MPQHLDADEPAPGDLDFTRELTGEDLEVMATARTEHTVLVDLPDGTTQELGADSAHVAYVLAAVVPADYALRGIHVTATPVERLWVLADEREITQPFPDPLEGP